MRAMDEKFERMASIINQTLEAKTVIEEREVIKEVEVPKVEIREVVVKEERKSKGSILGETNNALLQTMPL